MLVTSFNDAPKLFQIVPSKFIKFMIHIVVETVLPIVKISITASSKITAIIWTCRGTRSVHRRTVRKKRW